MLAQRCLRTTPKQSSPCRCSSRTRNASDTIHGFPCALGHFSRPRLGPRTGQVEGKGDYCQGVYGTCLFTSVLLASDSRTCAQSPWRTTRSASGPGWLRQRGRRARHPRQWRQAAGAPEVHLFPVEIRQGLGRASGRSEAVEMQQAFPTQLQSTEALAVRRPGWRLGALSLFLNGSLPPEFRRPLVRPVCANSGRREFQGVQRSD